MTPRERAARALWIASGKRPELWDAPPTALWKIEMEKERPTYFKLAHAAMEAFHSPIDGWLSHQIQHGCAPEGHPVEMGEEYALGRRVAFQATQAIIDAALAEGPSS